MLMLMLGHSPAAKCSGVDLRPAVSLLFTLSAVSSFLTRSSSPLRQASNSSLPAPGSNTAGEPDRAEQRRSDIR